MWVSGCGYNWHHDSDFRAHRPEGAGGNILMIVRSPARITVNGQVHYSKGNCVVLYRQRSAHIYGAHNAPFINDWVRFRLDEEDFPFLEGLGITFDSFMEFSDVYDLSHLVKLISAEIHSVNQNSVESTTYLLRLLFLKLSDYIYKKPAAYSSLAKKLMTLRSDIFSAPQGDWSIDAICESLHICPSHLQHKYKQLFGNSIKSDITTSRLDYAKYLLSGTDLKISTIAHSIGYENDVHFMYMFKKNTGMTPSQYRNSSALPPTPQTVETSLKNNS